MTLPADHTLRQACHACGYLRIGLADGANCPECGTPPPPPIGEIESAAWHALPFTARVGVVRALRVAEVAIVLMGAGFLLSLLTPLFSATSVWRPLPMLVWLGAGTAFIAALVLQVAVWRGANPTFGHDTATARAVWQCRGMVVASTIAITVAAAVWIIGPPGRRTLTLGTAALGVMLLEAAVMISVLRPLARATTNHNLDRDLHAMRWFLLIAGVPCLCLMLPAYLGLWLACINTTRRALLRDMRVGEDAS